MSWLARSLANSLMPDLHHHDDEEEDEEDAVANNRRTMRAEVVAGSSPSAPPSEEEESGTLTPGRGVKEDFSELTKTLTRQLWGVASFLAPPPENPSSLPPPESSTIDGSSWSDPSELKSSQDSDHTEVLDSPRMAGIRSDFAEIGGKFRTGFSKLSNNMAVSEISKIASTLLPFGSEGDEEDEEDFGDKNVSIAGAVGVTEEVLTFARNISMHPETWLDFPLFPEEEDSDDFDISDAQQEHALAVERLAPRLAALRIELCPSHMSEGCFWKIYFVLLHSRLNKHDADLLSTPQIVEARSMLLQDLQNRTKPEPDRSTSYRKEVSGAVSSGDQYAASPRTLYESPSAKKATFEEPQVSMSTNDFETEKHPVMTTEIKIIDKSVVEEELPVQSKNKISVESVQIEEEDGDEWLEEEENVDVGGSGVTSTPVVNEEDVSFSDLEEEDDDNNNDRNAPTTSSETATHTYSSKREGSRGWVQLNRSSSGSERDGKSTSPETKESNEWLNVEDIDI